MSIPRPSWFFPSIPRRVPAPLGAAFVALALLTLPLAGKAAETTPASGEANDHPPASEAPKPQLDTVVVTAQKRKEDASKVPVSISVLGGEELRTSHITDITDVTRAIPNVSFSSQGLGGAGPGLSNIEIRGVSSSAGSNTTGIYLDDVSMTTRNIFSLGAAEPKFFDLERIEVLRGPQGTLYGAGSEGGTVKFVSNQPDARMTSTDVHTELSSTQGGGINSQTTAVFNTPLIENQLALRIGLLRGHTSGYITQVDANGNQIASNINTESDEVLKLALKWTPTAKLSITPQVFFQTVRTGDIDASYLQLPINQTSKLVREPGVDRLTVSSLTINDDLDFADLTSVTSYFQRLFDRTQDGTAVNSEYIGSVLNAIPSAPAGLGNAVYNLPSVIALNNIVNQFSQEIRLASKPYDAHGTPLTWIGGAYYSKLHTNLYDNEPVIGLNDTFKAYGANPADPNLLGFAAPGDYVYQSLRHYTTEQKAVFGDISYHFSPSVYASAGLRALQSQDSIEQDLNYYFSGGPQHIERGASGSAVTPKISITWEVDAGQTVYATAAKGARLGSENRFIPGGVCAQDLQNQGLSNGVPNSYGPDSLWSYELGSKSRLLDNRLSINAAVFYIKWSQLQQDIQLPICGFDYETNVGRASSQGFEFEVKGKPFSNLTLAASGGYTRATVGSDLPVLGVKAGDPIAGVPDYNAALSADYRFQLSDSMRGFLRGSSDWVGSSHGTLVKTDPDYQRPGYNTTTLSTGASYEQWELALYAKNLFNDQRVIQRPNVEFLDEGYRLRPRTIGLSLTGLL